MNLQLPTRMANKNIFYQKKTKHLCALFEAQVCTRKIMTGLMFFICSITLIGQTNPDAFITTWNTENPGISDSNSITFPTASGEIYNYTIDWGDGTIENITTTTPPTHTYANPGIVTISITGDFPRIANSTSEDAAKLLTVEQWGTIAWNSMSSAFSGAVNLDVVATDVPDLSNVTTMSGMFSHCSNLQGNGAFNNWDTSNIINMGNVFNLASNFNADISSWDTSNVISMANMFREATAFNADISNWNTSNVTIMLQMFFSASTFNADIGNWDTSNVTNMNFIFTNATSFNAAIGNWDTSNITDMRALFDGASNFNGDISDWDTSNVITMDSMFRNATAFNANLSNWDTSNVTIMSGMFRGATAFNQDIGAWDTGNVTTMLQMFFNASSFNQDIGAWDISSLTNAAAMLIGIPLSTANYDALLNGWSTLESGETQIPQNITTFIVGANFCFGEAGRDILTGLGWAITDDGRDCAAFEPIITSAAISSVPENQTTAITVVAEDPQEATITFQLTGGTDQNIFIIDTDTGLVSFITAPDFETPLDDGTDNVYNIQVTATNSNNFSTAQDITITVTDIGESPCPGGIITTYDGTDWDNGIPDADDLAIIAGDYDTAIAGDFTACELRINTTTTLTVADGNFINILNDIIVDGILDIANTGSVVQVSNDAQVIKNGAISVTKTTPLLRGRDFIFLSSPMTAETNGGVYAAANRVFSIISENFIPNTDPALAGVVGNFIDDNGDYFDNLELDSPLLIDDATGLDNILNPTQGFVVSPQAAGVTTAINFEHTYTQGTLNTGILVAPIVYNGPATENNFNLLGNPYASAIDTDALITTNPAINEVFFWEHITIPNGSLPGPGGNNFSMDDVSVRNLTMGIAAVNDPDTSNAPGQFMASGQGFAILAEQTAAGTDVTFNNALRVTGNNGTPRSSQQDNRLRLRLDSESFTIQSIVGVGFLPEATAGFDPGYDSERLATTIGLFSTLENGEQLVIQGRESFDPTIQVDLGFTTLIPESETYTISIDQLEGSDLEQSDIFLIDNLLNTVTDLKETAYTFASSETIQTNRFTLVFEEQLLNVDENSVENNISLFPNPTQGQLTINSANARLQQAVIYDLTGRLVQTVVLDGSTLQMDVGRLSSGSYLLQLTTVLGDTITKRFIKE